MKDRRDDLSRMKSSLSTVLIQMSPASDQCFNLAKIFGTKYVNIDSFIYSCWRCFCRAAGIDGIGPRLLLSSCRKTSKSCFPPSPDKTGPTVLGVLTPDGQDTSWTQEPQPKGEEDLPQRRKILPLRISQPRSRQGRRGGGNGQKTSQKSLSDGQSSSERQQVESGRSGRNTRLQSPA